MNIVQQLNELQDKITKILDNFCCLYSRHFVCPLYPNTLIVP